MGIPERQLESWSRQGAVSTAKATHESLRHALEQYRQWPGSARREVYLQGSYRNSTNTRGDSDVDLVTELKSTFVSRLSALSVEEKGRFQESYPDATYSWSEFRVDVLTALREYYGLLQVEEGNKAVKIAAGTNRLPADVVVCITYREYKRFLSRSNEDYVEGILFYALRDHREIINFPKQHYQNGVRKHDRTNKSYKPAVRMFKNARSWLVENGAIEQDLAPSYFLECLLYNVPDGQFGGSFEDTFLNILAWLVTAYPKSDHTGFSCQNEQQALFGDTPEQWQTEKYKEFLVSLGRLWTEW